jgi:hypothetical protein
VSGQPPSLLEQSGHRGTVVLVLTFLSNLAALAVTL